MFEGLQEEGGVSAVLFLENGDCVLVDLEDWPMLRQFKWKKRADGRVYQVENSSISLHRLLCGYPENMDVHHKNEDPLDNRRSNLEILTRSEHVRRHHKQRRDEQQRQIESQLVEIYVEW